MIRIFLYPIVIILYILANIFTIPSLPYMVGIFANIAIVVSLFYANGLYFYSGVFFYISGLILFFYHGLTWQDFLLQFDTMLGILALFLLLPFLNSLILVGRYDQHLRSLLQYKVDHAGDLYQRGAIVTHILGLFLNIATIPLLLKAMQSALKSYSKSFTDVFYAKSLLRGYALCLMWSPMEILIIQTIDITGQNYLFVLPFLLLFCTVILCVDTVRAKRKYTHLHVNIEHKTISLREIFSKISELTILLTLLVSAVTALNHFLHQGYLFSLVLLIIPISFVWAMRIHKVKRYVIHSFSHWKERTKGLANYFFMFLSAGFFVNMISDTLILDIVQRFILGHADQTILLFFLISAFFLITGYIGFHPLVSIVLLGETLRPFIQEITSIPLAIVLIICSLSTVMFSPFNLSISILASELKTNIFRVGIRNLPFSIVIMLSSIAFASLIHFVTGFIK
ncbi:hypothetical protein ACLIBH_00525 [Virgibacillus sp. W0430]|uniref:hypothetical protein n=1 Tax=Virgibacillus sp. W0430 TaxID=3391580 RepID=UPI003F466BA8